MSNTYTPRRTAKDNGLVMQCRRIGASLFAVGGLGADGFVAKSDDDGKTWSNIAWRNTVGAGPWKSSMPKTGQHGLRHIWGESVRELFVVGEYGTLLHSTDGGASFAREKWGATGCVFGVIGHGDSIYAAGDDGIFKRPKDGAEWTIIDATRDLCRIWPVGDGLVVLGDHGAFLRVVEDDAVVRVRMPVSADWYGLCVDGDRMIVVGNNGAVVVSEDGGRTFEPGNSGVRGRLMAVAKLGDGYIAVGEKGAVVTSSNGLRWALEEKPPAMKGDYWGCDADGDVVWLAGDGGRVWRARSR